MKLHISTKIVIAVLILVTLVIGISSSLAFRFYRKALIDEMTAAGMQIAQTVVSGIHGGLMVNDRHAIRELIRAVGGQEGVAQVRLYDLGGEIRYSSVSGEEGTSFPMDNPTCRACHLAEGGPPSLEPRTRMYREKDGAASFLSVLDPIANEPGCSNAACHVHHGSRRALGLLEVIVPMERMERRVNTGKLHTALFGLASLLAITLILIVIARWLIITPVEKLVRATQRVAEGEWGRPISGAHQDELGDLIRSFNKMQENLEVSQRQLMLSEKLASVGKLAAGVAHEINNPLTGILTFAEDLLDESAPGDPRREDYEVIMREAIRCRNIVRNLLDFARQDELSVATVDMNDVIRRTVTLVRRLAQFQNCHIIEMLQGTLPLVKGDPGQLQQVFLNLLVNATEAMTEGGEIHIITRHLKGDPLVETVVADTGPGMEPDQIKRIFEPFYSTKHGKTQGLGLSVSWGIIEQHGGSMDVKSSVGEGTSFTVRLPIYWGKPPRPG